MATSSEVPVRVTDEAREWIARVGMQREFGRILAHTHQMVPGLRAIEVVLDPDPGETVGPGIVIGAMRDNPSAEFDQTDMEWGKWQVESFPPEVCLNFVMLSRYGAVANAR